MRQIQHFDNDYIEVIAATDSVRCRDIWHPLEFTLSPGFDSGISCGEAEIVIKQGDVVILTFDPQKAVAVLDEMVTLDVEGFRTADPRRKGSFRSVQRGPENVLKSYCNTNVITLM